MRPTNRHPLSTLVTGAALLIAATTLGCDRPLSVARSPNAFIDNVIADNIFGGMSTVVKDRHGPGDFACAQGFAPIFPDAAKPIIYRRALGGVLNLPLPNFINGPADLDQAFRQSGYVKVVQQINFCDGYGADIVGCAPIDGRTMVVVRVEPHLEGILWAHEFGHSVGLQHIENRFKIMNPILEPTALEMDAGECHSFAREVDGENLAPATLPASARYPQPAAVARGTPIEDVVHALHVHGVPWVTPDLFPEGTADRLVSMLTDPGERAHRGKIAALLGMLGDERAGSVLMDVVSSARSMRDGNDVGPTTSALMGLGYLAQRTRSRAVLDFLTQASDSAFWFIDSETLAHQMQSSAAIGLALSGRPAARQRLEELRASARDGWMRPTVDTALSAHETIASRGLAAYYKRR
jgi:hypothetical protein